MSSASGVLPNDSAILVICDWFMARFYDEIKHTGPVNPFHMGGALIIA